MDSRLSLKAPEYLAGDALEAHRNKITELAEQLRSRKAAGADNRELLDIISQLLEMKFLDPANDDCKPPKDFKLRWRVKTATGMRTLQRPVRFRTTISAEEILHVVETYTRKQLKDVGSVLKLELIESNDDGQKVHRTLCAGDSVTLPLVFPGPVLKECHVVHLRVTFSEPPQNISFPKSMEALDCVPSFIDCGVNLYDEKAFPDNEIDNVLLRAFAAGVEQLILISVDATSSRRNVSLAQRYRHALGAVVGVHPGQASMYPPTPDNVAAIRELASQPGVIGIGEVGLDFSFIEGGSRYRAPKECDNTSAEPAKPAVDDNDKPSEAANDTSKPKPVKYIPPTKEHQLEWFKIMLALAAELKLPLLLHEREAFAAFVEVLRPLRAGLGRATVNCFNGTAAEFNTYTDDLDLFVCVTGLLCNDDRGEQLRQTIRDAKSLDRVVIGTDAPYLLPFATMERPFPKGNTPNTLPHVAAYLAQLRAGHVAVTAPKRDEKDAGAALSDAERRAQYLQQLQFGGEDVSKIAETCALLAANTRTAFGLQQALRSRTPLAGGAAGTRLALNYYPVPPVASGADGDKAANGASEAAFVLPDGLSDNDVFLFGRKYLKVTEKEKVILSKQKEALDADAFAKLVADFALDVVAELPEPKKKKAANKPGKRSRSAPKRGGAARGRGRARMARGGRGRGRGRGH